MSYYKQLSLNAHPGGEFYPCGGVMFPGARGCAEPSFPGLIFMDNPGSIIERPIHIDLRLHMGIMLDEDNPCQCGLLSWKGPCSRLAHISL